MKRWTIALSVGAVGAVIGGVFFYNQVVNNNHEVAQQRNELRDVEVKNAELKSALYAMTDTSKVEELAVRRGLVVEKNPEYVKRQEVSINL